MKMLVTGGAGFIGTHLCRAFISQGHQVLSYDLKDGQDIMILSDLKEMMQGCEVVLHLAAEKSVPKSWETPKAFFKTNIQGTFNVLKSAVWCNVRRVVLASSSSVYGGCSPYAVSKQAMEALAQMYWQVMGLETCCLRLFNVFGPSQDPVSPYASVVPQFAKAIRNGHPPIVYGDGQQSRDFTYVENVIEAFRLAIHAEKIGGVVCDVGTGVSHTLLELLSTMCAILGLPIPIPQFESRRVGDLTTSCANLDLSRQWLNYEPIVDFHTGLERTLHG